MCFAVHLNLEEIIFISKRYSVAALDVGNRTLVLTEANVVQHRISALFGGNELTVAVRNRPPLLVKPGQSAQADAPVVALSLSSMDSGMLSPRYTMGPAGGESRSSYTMNCFLNLY